MAEKSKLLQKNLSMKNNGAYLKYFPDWILEKQGSWMQKTAQFNP